MSLNPFCTDQRVGSRPRRPIARMTPDMINSQIMENENCSLTWSIPIIIPYDAIFTKNWWSVTFFVLSFRLVKTVYLSVYDYLFINDTLIEKVESIYYLNKNFLLSQLFFQCYHTILSCGTGQPPRKKEKKREKLIGLFYRQTFDLDIYIFISDSIQKLSTSFITDVNDILHCCYVKVGSKFFMPKTRTKRFLKSFK